MRKWLFILMIVFLALFVLCFFPSLRYFDYYAQYIRALDSGSESTAKWSISLNPLYPHSHMLLSSIYLKESDKRPELFNEALKELEIAVRLGPRRGKISWNALRTFLSLWPFLDEEQKKLAIRAGKIAIRRLKLEEVEDILNLWSTYCRDFDFLAQILEEKPYLFRTVGEYVKKNKLPLDWRWKALTLYEDYLVEKVASERADAMSVSELKSSLSTLKSIRFYYRLSGLKFHIKLYKDLFENISWYLATKEPSTDVILDFADSTSSTEKIKELLNHLEETGYFAKRTMERLYTREYLLYRSKNYDQLKAEVNSFVSEVGWVKKDEMEDYIRMRLLLADIYYEENLLLSARQIVDELLKIDPQNPEVLLRLKRIKEMLGEDFTEKSPYFLYGPDVKVFINSGVTRFYFSPLVGQKQMVVFPAINPRFAGKLLTVYMNGEVAFEEYVENINQQIKIPLPGSLDFYRVEIRIW